jgi:signal transduction histidine kinase
VRISTRFGFGAALAVLPLLGVMAYSVERMQDLAQSNERITMRQLVGIQMSSGVIRRLERLEEYQRKYVVSEDYGYALKFAQTVEATSDELKELRPSRLSPEEAGALRDLRERWGGFAERSHVILVTLDEEAVASEFSDLQALAVEVQQATRRAAATEAETAATVREEIRQTALVVAGIALLLSLTLILLTVRSLRTRLEHFMLGTVAVSKGAFSFQLEVQSDDELGQVARAFNRMVDALRQLERMKADFISSVSHELKTPLVAMLETNHLLLDEVPGPLTERQERMIRLNTQAAQRLSSMITDLLELSRLKAELRYQMSDQDVRALTVAAVSELEALALERELELGHDVVDSRVVVRCDPDRYIQIVQNLVENALKYTPAGGRIEVGLRVCAATSLPDAPKARLGLGARSVAEHAILSVDDSGPGIPEEDRERVFEKFFRRQGEPAGGSVGLGLAICREIIEAHGGAIWVDESPLGGTSMKVALPVEASTIKRRRMLSR